MIDFEKKKSVTINKRRTKYMQYYVAFVEKES